MRLYLIIYHYQLFYLFLDKMVMHLYLNLINYYLLCYLYLNLIN